MSKKEIGEKPNKETYVKLEVVKKGMSQLFDENAKVVPFTELFVADVSLLKDKTVGSFERDIIIKGVSKGSGFTGTMKRWNFSGQRETHGQKDYHRGQGSIGAQGEGKVIKGRKMPGHGGLKHLTIKTKLVDITDSNIIRVKGGVPGGINSKAVVYLREVTNVN